MGMDISIVAPEKYWPDAALRRTCEEIAAQTGSRIHCTEDVKEGTAGADIISTDVWVSMGEPDEIWEERIRDLTPYRVDRSVMDNAGKEAIFLHCLPSFHDLGTGIGQKIHEKYGLTEMEVTDEVFESAQSLVFQEAENRMHTIKAVLYAAL